MSWNVLKTDLRTCTHHASEEAPGFFHRCFVVCEPITAEGRGQGATEDEEQAGPGDHDEDDEDPVRC